MTVLPVEELDQGLRELMELAKNHGREAERAAKDAGAVLRRIPGKPDLSEDRLDYLRDLLTDEVVVSHEISGDTVISPREEDREIAKAALAHLKLPQLRKLAGDFDLPKGGSLEHVADRIVEAFRADQAEIAQLVVRYEEEPPPDRRMTVRVYPLGRLVENVAGARAALEHLVDRYIRVGIARWFIFESVSHTDSSMVLDGTYRHYLADAHQDDDDGYSLRAEKKWASASLRLTAGSPFVSVEARGTAESRAIVTAFSFATGIQKYDLTLDGAAVAGAAFQWSPKTAFMVDLILTQFRSDTVEVFNLTTAGFERADEKAVQDDVETRPAVRSVRLQGTHLLDSRPACELVVAGQSLIDLSLLARFAPSADESVLLPLNVKLARDHVAISVGFGIESPELARQLRDVVAAGVRTALRSWPKDSARLKQTADAIRARAESDEIIERADMFGPPVADAEAD